jgi:long-subunit acyl-CoA synthetase (AMP-forming)
MLCVIGILCARAHNRVPSPTIFFGVPRVWEKIMEKMKQIGESTTGLKKQLISWAKARGAEAYVGACWC